MAGLMAAVEEDSARQPAARAADRVRASAHASAYTFKQYRIHSALIELGR
jgi:hypothetical protein